MSEKKALFVCLGNICRSPLAEAVFLKTIKTDGIQDQWIVDSAAIGPWHAGKKPDHRAQETMRKHDLPYHNKAKQIKKSDFNDYDYIFGMDSENINDLKSEAPSKCRAKILLLGDYDPEGEKIIRDPYYDRGSEGFEKCYEQCVRCCRGFLDKLDKNSST